MELRVHRTGRKRLSVVFIKYGPTKGCVSRKARGQWRATGSRPKAKRQQATRTLQKSRDGDPGPLLPALPGQALGGGCGGREEGLCEPAVFHETGTALTLGSERKEKYPGNTEVKSQ